MTGRMRIAILDDYQNVATRFADWDSLEADVVVFTKPFTDADDVVRSLAGFDVLVAIRERTQFPAEVLEKLTGIRLLVSTGSANAAIDLSAAGRLGITVCATGYVSDPTVEQTWALILAAERNLLVEADSMRTGGWQVTVGTGLRGKTLGVVGLGRVGSMVARIGQAFGMTTIAWSQNLTPQKAAEHDVQAVTKEQLKRPNSSLMPRVFEPVISRTIGKTVYNDLRRMESIIRDSHLDLTIVRPSILFELDHPTGYIARDVAPVGGFTARIDLPDHADRRRIEHWRHPHRLRSKVLPRSGRTSNASRPDRADQR